MSLAIWIQILSRCRFFINRITIDSHRSSHSANNNFEDFGFLFHGHNTSVFSSCLTSPFPWSSDNGSTPLTCPLSPCYLFMALQPVSCDVVFVFFSYLCICICGCICAFVYLYLYLTCPLSPCSLYGFITCLLRSCFRKQIFMEQ